MNSDQYYGAKTIQLQTVCTVVTLTLVTFRIRESVANGSGGRLIKMLKGVYSSIYSVCVRKQTVNYKLHSIQVQVFIMNILLKYFFAQAPLTHHHHTANARHQHATKRATATAPSTDWFSDGRVASPCKKPAPQHNSANIDASVFGRLSKLSRCDDGLGQLPFSRRQASHNKRHLGETRRGEKVAERASTCACS